MFMGNDRLFPILAMIVLLVGISSSIYVSGITNEQKIDDETIIINDVEYSKSEFLSSIEQITISTDSGEKTGYPLDQMIIKSGVNCHECHKYTFKAVEPDPYQQTVQWTDIKTGVFSLDKNRVYFPDLTHSFWVYNVVEIEVN